MVRFLIFKAAFRAPSSGKLVTRCLKPASEILYSISLKQVNCELDHGSVLNRLCFPNLILKISLSTPTNTHTQYRVVLKVQKKKVYYLSISKRRDKMCDKIRENDIIDVMALHTLNNSIVVTK